MQPEINPNYFRYQNPFMQNYFNPQPTYPYNGMQSQMQNTMQNQQMHTSYMPKVVDGIDAVKATDIPMDGNMYYFPKADGTEIYAKKWNADGSTSITSYLPLEAPKNDSMVNSSSKSFQEKIDALETYSIHIQEQMDALVSMLEKNVKGSGKKKEVNSDEC